MKHTDPAWRANLQAHANRPPARPRVPLWSVQDGERVQIGSVEPEFLGQIANGRLSHHHCLLQKVERIGRSGWEIEGELTLALHHIGLALRAAGLAGVWRDEPLAVCSLQGKRLGTVERGVVRPLGIATRAVHLVGLAPGGNVWLQQRALDKATDPGLWDTLMGGMVSAQDTVETALARETWEEAGLKVGELDELHYRGFLRLSGPSRDGGGTGYVTERIDWYSAVVPDALVPENQDGEVAQFKIVERAALIDMLHQGQLTTEAAGILCEVIGDQVSFAYDRLVQKSTESTL